MIDENLIFVALLTIFTIFIIYKKPVLVATLIAIIIVYCIYKNYFINPRDFISFITTKTKEAFEPCNSGNMAYCGNSRPLNNNMTFLPDIMRSMEPNPTYQNIMSSQLKAENYQIDRRLKFGATLITIDEIIKEIPILLDYKLYLEKMIKYIINIKTDDPIQKDFLARQICNKMSKIFYNAYNTISNKKYPINTYNELLYTQRGFDETLNIFVFLGMNDTDTKNLENLQKEFKELNYKLNEFVIEKVNNIMPNDYDITTSFLPHKDEPVGISVLDNYF